jgi:hypothetical protein
LALLAQRNGVGYQKMKNIRTITLYGIAGLLSVILLISIGLVQKRMNNIIVENKLRDTELIKNAPPIITFTTIALGSFRGLLADLLWMRSIALQDEGNYFEMVQLASWITKLQPKFTGATAFLAWNMAYNISVTCSSFADRWKWVQRGIELIRDEALVYNPSDPNLYRELGWIYQHKIGNIMDDANLYYKNNLAIEMMKVFGGPEPDWQALAKAPKTLEEFQKKFPPKNRLWKVLKDSGYTSFDTFDVVFKAEGGLPEIFKKNLNDPQTAKALENFLRSKWLREVYKLKPEKIIQINEKYGKLDWRLPESQAIYWATMGLECAPDHKDVQCKRMITQSLNDAFQSGWLLMVDEKGYENNFITIPNLNVVDSVRAIYEEAYQEHQQTSFRSALENFMKDAIVTMYNYGKYSKAKEYLEYLRKEYPNNKNYRSDLDSFAIKEWLEDVRDATLKQANNIVSGLIYRSCNFLVYGDINAAAAQERMARFVYRHYQKEQADVKARMGLGNFKEIKSNIIKSCLKNWPPKLSTLLKAQLKTLENQKQENLKEETKKAEK